MFLLNPYGVNPSPFEAAISALSPDVWYRFRDSGFSTQIGDSSGNGHDLVKQIAAATRHAIKIRSTHPGGAYFPSVTHTNYATQGTLYKAAAANVLSAATEYTALISFRMIAKPSNNLDKLFAVGTENVDETGTNDLVLFRASQNAPTNPHYWKHRNSGAGLIPVDWAVTENIEDGVNRLMIVRCDFGTLFRMTSSKPGHIGLTEESASATGTALATLSRALILNARNATGTGSNTTLEMVVDQIALFDSDIGATAETNLHTLWAAEVSEDYYPSMMQYDGSTGYYTLTNVTTTGNKFSCFIRFNMAAKAGTSVRRVFEVKPGGGGGDERIIMQIGDSSITASGLEDRIECIVKNSATTVICKLASNVDVADSEDHCLFFEFDGDVGTAQFVLDGIEDAFNESYANHVAPTTGTLGADATTSVALGGTTAGATLVNGKIGTFGYADVGGLDAADFMDGNLPKAIDEKNWTEFGGTQPEFWAHDGELANSKGSAGDCTKNGTITRTVGGSP